MRNEILNNFENVSNGLTVLLDELLCACEHYPIIKRLFWSVSF
jgi:glutamate racemase